MPQTEELTGTGMGSLDTSFILDSLGVGMFALNLQSGDAEVSGAWKRMIGLDPNAEVMPQSEWGIRIHPDDVSLVQSHHRDLIEGHQEESKFTFRFKHESGDWMWIQSVSGVTTRDTDGFPLIISGVHTDVTEYVMREKSKDDYLAMISHELRTPLTSILGALKMANSGQIGELPGPVSNVLQLAQRNSNRLLHLVNEILDFKSIESGEMNYDLARHNARDVASDAILSMQGYMQEGQSIVLVGEEGDEPIYIDADVNRLQQILANLLSNAVKFSPEHSDIELGLVIKGQMLEMSVRDHGPGVPDELEGKMFKRFTQAKTGGQKKFKSTGLGLSICKQMTEGMGGEIGYFNNEGGDGATFWATFPLASDN